MFTVAICDDDKIVLSSIQKCIEEFATENNISISVDLYDSGKKLLESSPKYNVIFLDIILQTENGIDIGTQLRKLNAFTYIIYITNYKQYHETAHNNVHSFAFLTKPISKKIIYKQLNDILIYESQNNDPLYIARFITYEQGLTEFNIVIAKELWSVPLWLTNTVLNIPLFAAGFFFCGWRFIKRTLFATVMLSVSLYVLPEASYLGSDLFLSALFGGIISGVGTGLVFLTSCTTGGTDLLAALIQKRLKHYTLAQIMQVLDGLIVVAGASVFGIRSALYALIAIFCVAKVTDGLIEGLKFSKQAYIISEHYREIAEAIMEQMGRGVTSIKARGMYSDQEKRMLFCVVSKKEIVRLKEIVAEFDSSAFVIVSDAREVFGEGFIEY